MAIPAQSRPGGKRLNKLPVIFAVFLIMAFAVSMSFVASKRGNKNVGNEEMAASNDVVNSNADGDVGLQELVDSMPDSAGIHYDAPPMIKDGEGDEDDAKKPARDVRQEVLDAIQDQQLQDIKERQQAQAMNERNKEKIEQASYSSPIDVEMKHLDSEKNISKSKVDSPVGLSSPESPAVNNEYGNQNNSSVKNNRKSEVGDVNEKRNYLKNKKKDLFILNERVRTPISDYEVKTGSVIPGTFISSVNSSLPGDIIAQVSRDVFDSRTGKHLLIPQGSKLYGRYDSATVLGQDRLLVVWDRIIYPDTESLSINSMQGVDGRGLSGMKDKVNTHFVKTLLNAFLLSVVSATADKNDKNDSTGFLDGIRSEYGDTMERVISEYLNKRLNIRPEIEIRAGMRFNILISKDLIFDSPYQYGFSKRIVENEYNK